MSTLESAEFQRAFAAFSYLLGQRDRGLSAPVSSEHPELRALVRRLSQPEQTSRAQALAHELSRLAAALEARTYK